MNNDKVIHRLKNWTESNDTVRALIVTSSRSGKTNAPIDDFSDYDIVVYVNSLDKFRNDDWLSSFGDILVKWPLTPESEFGENWITRLVMFENRTRIDFQITTETKTPPLDFDLGYSVVIDKDGFTKDFPDSTKTKHLIKKPSQQEFAKMVNAFFWDATYIPKYLYRGDLFYTSYMIEVDLRFSHLEPMIEWYIGSKHNWSVNTNVHGRYFPKYLDKETLKEIEETFAGANQQEVWKAFFKMVEIFTGFAKEVAAECGYSYPKSQEKRMMEYFKMSKKIFDHH